MKYCLRCLRTTDGCVSNDFNHNCSQYAMRCDCKEPITIDDLIRQIEIAKIHRHSIEPIDKKYWSKVKQNEETKHE